MSSKDKKLVISTAVVTAIGCIGWVRSAMWKKKLDSTRLELEQSYAGMEGIADQLQELIDELERTTEEG